MLFVVPNFVAVAIVFFLFPKESVRYSTRAIIFSVIAKTCNSVFQGTELKQLCGKKNK